MTLQTLLFFLVVIPVMFFGLLIALAVNLIDPSGDRFHRMAAWWGRFCARLMGISIEITGEKHYDPNANYLIVSNHAGMADIPLILGSIHLNMRFVAKEELGKIPVFGWVLKQAGYVLIKRGQNKEALKSLLKASEVLKSGRSVHIFPEGTRSETGEIKPFKRGAFMIAQKANAPILPVTIIGSNRITPKKSLRISKAKIQLIIGKPIETKEKNAQELQDITYTTITSAMKRHKTAA
ncbi:MULTISPECIES: lysophospholipid acyltransferase family protein [Prosthecochloris]|uniref:1-acyl-sn-glycerol-3-phosphate acyltransferase n=1 Tax=Prosthecochloris marina TaxID=2017681 RepID=A0A317T808_9CHLB|nr:MULTISPECIES: lysophospholipid acyltransferase family protein [Prosthecochloris]PWW82450.1 1-acyl-sn-glycerol-3-phosphate acyltransferase [Prosthecochloris marina]UZJ37435.1 1-acyl-sn-glycerol-3-phosphate acyltransferase [Prosthecochloris sp. SCSIO W1103]UZJ39258.1 1-acyl-sn-glycerol-3-phosphate acyltransferase [Prosthecochloris sp. SCSIO W1102]